MSTRWDEQELMPPIAADASCGESLEDTALLAAIEGTRLFGRARSLDGAADPDDRWKPPDWPQFRDSTLDTLRRSRDLRVLANLAVALLRTDGLDAFLRTLPVAAHWLGTYWADVYPRVDDGDAMLRRNALNCFADSMAIVDAARRLPLVRSRVHGSFSLRDIDVATGQQPAKSGENRVDESQIDAAFADTPAEDLKALHANAVAAIEAIVRIDTAMSTQVGADATPSLEAITAVLGRLERVLRAHLGLTAPGTDAAVAGPASAAAPMAVGAIHSREDAIRALDAVADYFKRAEPSSPIPLFVERARRLVAKSFLEVLADLVPDAVPQARTVGGIHEEA